MANPKSLTFALYSHWDVIERLVLLGREFPAFEQDQVIAVIAEPTSRKDEKTARQHFVSWYRPTFCSLCPEVQRYKFIQ